MVNQRSSESWQYDLNLGFYSLLCVVAEYLVCFYLTSFSLLVYLKPRVAHVIIIVPTCAESLTKRPV
jgi:hypothetical protein